ncbi:MAG: VWA domain-containing protein [Deltaproteobacteria bacterium]|nr:VWA domain-containing protein [Deltaproteobacteria bacterium]
MITRSRLSWIAGTVLGLWLAGCAQEQLLKDEVAAPGEAPSSVEVSGKPEAPPPPLGEMKYRTEPAEEKLEAAPAHGADRAASGLEQEVRDTRSQGAAGGSVAPLLVPPGPVQGSFAKMVGAGELRATSGKPTSSAFGEPFDEVWVIQRPPTTVVPDPNAPGSGELRTTVEGREIPLPLKHTEVKAAIEGYIASVTVTQQYQNPYGSKIEAVYVFPLPENAAVSDFVMVIGERKIRGIIREREEAQRIYTEARNQGYVAALLTQERPNVFTQKVANIEPGKRIDVEIAYFHTLAYADGAYSFVFPMVVGPRYNPAGSNDGIGAVGRGSHGASGQSTEVQYLKPGERSGHDIGLSVDLNAGVALEEVASTTHAIDVQRTAPARARIRIKPADTFPNKDFVLRFRVAGKLVKTGVVAEHDDSGGHFTLVLQPPASLGDLPRAGQEMVFVVDTSGSMMGWPIDKARKAIRRALQNLRPDDTFQLVQFANGFSTFAPLPVAATPDNVQSGLSWLGRLGAGGGTEMVQGIRGALDFPHDEKRFRIVSFFTDGFVGNEDQILRAVAEKLGPSRIFSFGVGSSVNRYLMEGLARVGRGAVAYLTTNDSDVEAVDRFFDTVAHPALTDVVVHWGGLGAADVYPRRIPDLFVGRPVILVGRFSGRGDTVIRVSGRVAGEERIFDVPVSLDALGKGKGIAKIWARARIADLTDRMAVAGENLAGEVKQTALTHGLLSAYTAFVAVDSTRRTEGTSGTTVAVPVPLPAGVRYETTVTQ